MKIQRVTVKTNERAVLLRNGDFERVLTPGTHWLLAALDRLQLERFPIGSPAFSHPLAVLLMAREPAVVAAHFVRVELGEHEAGLLSEDGALVEILPPGTRRLYWKGLVDVQVERVPIAGDDAVALPPATAARLVQAPLRPRSIAGLAGVLQVLVPAWATGVLTVDGRQRQLLPPGPHAFWRFGREVAVEVVDLRLQTLEVSGQEILTRDKVALRLNLSAAWRCTDVLAASAAFAKPAEHLYRALQLALRAAVGTRTLDELLDDKTVIDRVVAGQVRERLAADGITLDNVGVKDIVLPGEMKTLLAKVVEAGKSAEANVIRRREETAATRSLLNTAKVMEDNPVALRLKELETLERVAERIDRISVFGGLDQVLDGLVKLR